MTYKIKQVIITNTPQQAIDIQEILLSNGYLRPSNWYKRDIINTPKPNHQNFIEVYDNNTFELTSQITPLLIIISKYSPEILTPYDVIINNYYSGIK